VYYAVRPYFVKAGLDLAPVPIAVISFENQTGENSLDYLQKAIPSLIITNLEQSALFQTITWERMHDVMNQLGKGDVTFIDSDLGFEICRKEEIPFIVIGSFVKAGEVFVTDAKVLDVNTKQIITSVSTKGNGLSSILQSQIDELSKTILQSVRTSTRKASASPMHILDVTTNSLAAYDYFLKGREAYDKMYFDDARQLFEKAVSIDSGFAIAYLYLSHSFGALKILHKQKEALENAYFASARATEIEKITIRAAYAGIIQKDPQQQLKLLLQLAEKAPRDKRVFYSLGLWYRDSGNATEAATQFLKAVGLDPDYGEAINQLAYIYFNKGDFVKALEYLQKYASLNPADANPYDSMGDLYWRMGKLDESIESYKKALEMKPDFYFSATKIAYIYGMKEDYLQVNRWMEKAREATPSDSYRAFYYWSSAFVDYFYGKLDQSMQKLDKLSIQTAGNENHLIDLGFHWLKANIYFDLGQYQMAQKENNSYLHYAHLDPSRDAKGDSSGFYLLAGLCHIGLNHTDSAIADIERIKLLSRDLKNDFNYNYLEREIKITSAQHSAILDSIPLDVIQPLPVYDFLNILVYNVPFRRNSLAEAYQRFGMTDKSIAIYEQMITFDPSTSYRYLINPRYHYYLGILYQEKGLQEKAVEQYQKFLGLWQDADQGFKEPADAKKRLDRLLFTK